MANTKNVELPFDFATGFFDDYRLEGKLGQGRFAQVRAISSCGIASEEDNISCRKCGKFMYLYPECPEAERFASMEAYIAHKVGDHPNVVNFYGAYKEEDIRIVVMEKCNCSLSEYMGDLPELNERLLGKLVYQMLSSLHHLHSLRVVHRDVKPDNFLMGGQAPTVKLCDFGLAATLPDHGKLNAPVGTTPFMCPEMHIGSSYDESADIWSLAVTVYVYLFGRFPYISCDGTEEGMKSSIIQGAPPTFEPFGSKKHKPSSGACNFVHALLQRSGVLRPSAEEALNFSYMVMTSTGRHMQNVSLPSLHPELKSAYRIGAISSINLPQRTSMDDLLSRMQYRKVGARMPFTYRVGYWQTATSPNEKQWGQVDSWPLSKITEKSCEDSPRSVTPSTCSERPSASSSLSSQNSANVVLI